MSTKQQLRPSASPLMSTALLMLYYRLWVNLPYSKWCIYKTPTWRINTTTGTQFNNSYHYSEFLLRIKLIKALPLPISLGYRLLRRSPYS